VRSTQSYEVEHLGLVFLKVRQSGSADEAAQAERHKADLTQAVPRAELVDVGVDLLCEANAHLLDVAFSVAFVGRRHEEHDFWEDQGDAVLDHLHVLGVALETMDEHPEVDAVVVVLFWHDGLRPRLVS